MGFTTRPVTSQRAGYLFGILVFAATFLAQIALYHESFHVRPAGDDFAPPLAEIARGEREGPLPFFLETKQTVYRPLQSTTMWLFGRISQEHRFIWIGVMRFTSMGLYGLVCLLWIRQLGLGRTGTLVAAVAVFAHPAFGGTLGGIDTFSGFIAHAIMWVAALAVIVWRERFPLAVVAALICLIVGSLYKEYAFGLVPLAALTAFMFSPSKPLIRAIIIALVLLTFMITSLVARRFLGVEVDPRLPSLSLGHMIPRIAHNAALLATATVFTGNTVWVNVDRSALAFGWVFVNAGSVIALVSIGVVMMLRQQAATESGNDLAATRPGGFSSRRWVVFLLLSFLAASFPANLIPYRVSEIYVSGLMLPLALLCGLAAEGFARGPRWARWTALVLAAVHVVVACATVTAKVHGLRTAGDMAAGLLDQVAALVPNDARDQTVALVFVSPELVALPHYSVFLTRADRVFRSAEWALEYRLPGRGLVGERVYVDSLDEIDLSAHPLIVRWDQRAGQFVRMK